MVIRPYQSPDRAAVRLIAYETADRGKPVAGAYFDRELLADLVTRYYTDCEPQASWVAETGGDVVGYLTGCVDTHRWRRFMTWRIVPAALMRAAGRGGAGCAHVWRLSWAIAQTCARGGWRRPISLSAYPAHLHINVVEESRGQHVGRQLMDAFLAHALQAGVPGVHASVRADNQHGREFFERMGFKVIARRPVVLLNGTGHQRTDVLMYGRQV